MKSIALGALLLLATLGCVPPSPMVQKFNPEEFKPYMVKGTGKISGQAFLKTAGGDVKFGAGNKVELIPMTAYMRERVERVMRRGERLEERDWRVINYQRETVADGNGNFEFTEIPPGEYVVYCLIQWQVSSGIYTLPTGDYAYGVVKIAEGESKKVIVTR